MQVDLDTIQTWANKWQVIFNPLKWSKSYLPKYVINQVYTHKYLGLTWNSDASWKSHMSTVIAKVSERIDMLRSLKLKLDRSSLEKMYFAYIRPIFEYANVVWDSAPRQHYYFTTIEKLQISAARIVTGTKVHFKRFSSRFLRFI